MSDWLAKSIFLLGLFTFAAVRLPQEFRARKLPRRTSERDRIEWLLVAVATVGLVVVPVIHASSGLLRRADYVSSGFVQWIGAGLFLGGIALIYAAHRQLGRNFSSRLVVVEGHALVTRGVYAYVRHPIYAGFWLWASGQALMLPNWIAGASGLAGFSVLYLFRVGKEEELMLQIFGKEYRAYMQRTPRLLYVPALRIARHDRG